MDNGRWSLCLSIVCLTTLSALANTWAEPAGPAVTRQQIEADWLRQDELRGAATGGGPASDVKPEEDAAGGVDGHKTGKWGFHTAPEPNPWWQVDLKQDTAIDRVVLYNRGDGYADRASQVMVLLSADGKQFKQAYRHDGTVFGGQPDNRPLVVKLGGKRARYVRLQLPATTYFHLDEVEVYTPGGKQNVALRKPAAQSSVSQWSAKHGAAGSTGPQGLHARDGDNRTYPIALAIQRGLKLADDLRRSGANVDAETGILKQAAQRYQKLPADAPRETQRQAYFQVRWAVRAMALKNPLLDFDRIVFVKRAPGSFPHVSDQHYGWWSRPGGGIFILEGFKTDNPRLRSISEGFPQGCFEGPELSFDGQRLLFAHCRYYPQVAHMKHKSGKENVPEDAFYHIFEINVDGSGLRQLTHGRYDDFDARYLPNGEIVFLSTRKGQFLQCNKFDTSATVQATLPDSYVRCGGDDYRPVPVFTLHAMNRDGGDMRPMSAFENFEWTPSVAWDGRILYARWDYIDRFNGYFFSLWSTNPDGTGSQLVFKNYTVQPQCVFEARAIPNSQKLIFTATAHHSITGGSLVLLDRTRGTEESRPITRLTPEVPFPEVEGWPSHYYASPWPLSETHYLVAWSDRPLPPHCEVSDDRNPVNAQGIYLYDAFGNLNLLYRDAAISSLWPIPLKARPMPPALPNSVRWDGPQEGRFMLQDVYRGLAGVPRGSIKQIRVIGVPPKTQPYMNSPSLGVSSEEPGKFVLGTAPVEADGSAYFRVPSGVSMFFQALDGDGLAVQTMRSLTYVQPGETHACIGCHESRDAAPAVRRVPLAVARGPSKLKAGPAGSWPLQFAELVQPVLDRQCVRCHSPASKEAKASRLDLTPARSYDSLLTFGGKNLHNLVAERDRSLAGNCPARNSKLLALLTAPQGHEGVKLDDQSLRRLATWMDTYGQRSGHFSAQQEAKLREFHSKLKPMLEE
jgi:hypothetical protein